MARVSPPQVAVVVPTADQGREPARTAIAQARKTVAALGASVHVVESSGPGFRFSRSVNRGMAEAPEADAWVLLNDDCFMDDGWLEAMLDTARRHPEVGVVGAVLRHPEGGLQHAGGYIVPWGRYTLQTAFLKGAPAWSVRRLFTHRRRHPHLAHYRTVDPRHRLDFVTGACMLVTRACRDRIGGFDEGYEFSCEDVDYCLRALEGGIEVALATRTTGVHLYRASGGGLGPAVARSEVLFDGRWPSRRIVAATRRGGRRGLHA